MLRDLIFQIAELETGNLGDEYIELSFGNSQEDQTTKLLPDIGSNAHSLKEQFLGLVERLSQRMEKLPEELKHFLEVIKLELDREQFKLLAHHPWLMLLGERFHFPANCLKELKHELKHGWKQKLIELTPADYEWLSKVADFDDCFQEVFNSPKIRAAYKNNYASVLRFCRNVIKHFHQLLLLQENGQRMEKYVHDFLCQQFPELMLGLFNFFFRNNLSLTFNHQEPEITLANTLFVGNLDYGINDIDLENFFAHVGQVSVRLLYDQKGWFLGNGLVEFASSYEAGKALSLDGRNLLDRTIELQQLVAPSIYVRGFKESLKENEIRVAMLRHFDWCGEITRLFIPTNENGQVNGIAFMEFSDADDFYLALECHKSILNGDKLTVKPARPKYNFWFSGGLFDDPVHRGDWTGFRRGGFRRGFRRKTPLH